ncbi:pyridoxal phosphate-dependent aminotransferase [Amycolatopsis sp., V23-08]|uniref:Aminotransferase n=1 Tax=Amycolatopsis heterodermiae TaxID=3110235 RepID=A0ABU5R295_9PSEU|nr:pyridoxal phosphate-dependent aminotransferase [Amycolatopsis sp., V23-08]MEA5360331.1 pyridoxal phosphate-dependent aminotransferase [Amycolatopsis sp., V23-08]
MAKRAARRLASVERSATVALLDRVQQLRAQGRSLVDLSRGEPDFVTPQEITEAAVAALRSGRTHYSPSRGLPELREAIAAKLLADNDVVVSAADGVLVTPSAKHALYAAFTSLLDPGDEVVIPSPGWVSYAAMVSLAGATPVPALLDPATGFRITEAVIEAAVTPGTRILLVNSPNNPTGRMLDAAELEAVLTVARRHDLVVISDEIYEHIRYDGHPHLSPAAYLRENTLTVNGFSKGYAMTGWRLGYLAGPADLVAAARKVQEHSVSCAATFTQIAGTTALEDSQPAVEEMVSAYTARRALLVEGLNFLPGVTCAAPEGSFYAFPDISGTGVPDGSEFAEWMLDDAGVVMTPGPAFGAGGRTHVRLSFAASEQELTDALERMDKALRSR